MSPSPKSDHQQFWLWVAKPKYTQDPADSTRDRPDMMGAPTMDAPDGWWTCHEDTERGDLALLYVTAPFCEIRWLIRTESKQLIDLRNDPIAQAEGFGDWGTEYTVLYRFDETITFAEMRGPLTNWDAITRRLRGNKGSWPMPKAYATILGRRLVSRNAESRDAFLDNLRCRPDWLDGRT